MITIPKKVEYSVIFIAHLAKNNGKTVSLSDAAKKLRLPYRFLGQLAMALKAAGIVDSKEGKAGGYSLVKGWNRKNLYDLLEGLGENRRMVKCLDPSENCARAAQCEMRRIWNTVEVSFVKQLKGIKLAQI